MKRAKSFPALICLVAILASSTAAQRQTGSTAPAQEATNADAGHELFVKHGGEEHRKRNSQFDLKNLKMPVELLEQRFGKTFNPEGFIAVGANIKMFAGITNIFWKDNLFQEQVFLERIRRIPLIPVETEKEWNTVLTEVLRYDVASAEEMPMFYTLGVIFLQDRLFEGNAFRKEESGKLLTRLRSLPRDTVVRWAEIRSLDKFQAAVSLMRTDFLFDSEVFQRDSFAAYLRKIGQPGNTASASGTSSEPIRSKPGKTASEDRISGEWSAAIKLPNTERAANFTLILKLDGESVAGHRVGQDGKITKISKGTWADQRLILDFDYEIGSLKATLTMSGRLVDGKLSGKTQITSSDSSLPPDLLSGSWEASRK